MQIIGRENLEVSVLQNSPASKTYYLRFFSRVAEVEINRLQRYIIFRYKRTGTLRSKYKEIKY